MPSTSRCPPLPFRPSLGEATDSILSGPQTTRRGRGGEEAQPARGGVRSTSRAATLRRGSWCTPHLLSAQARHQLWETPTELPSRSGPGSERRVQVHMDENGVCKFPADKLGLIVDNLQILQTEEDKVRPQGAGL